MELEIDAAIRVSEEPHELGTRVFVQLFDKGRQRVTECSRLRLPIDDPHFDVIENQALYTVIKGTLNYIREEDGGQGLEEG